MAVIPTGVFADAANLLPSTNDLVTSLITGAIGTVVLSGAQTATGQNALDPLHIFHKPADTSAGTPAVNGTVKGGNVMLMSAYLALSPENQKMVQAMNYTIIPG